MKKALLLGTLLAVGASAFAVTESATYENKGGYTFTNLWCNTYNVSPVGSFSKYRDNGIIPSLDYIRDAAVANGYMIVPSSKMFEGEGIVDKGQLILFDATTGEYVKNVQLTVNGAAYEGLLCANCIGVDNFGHVYICGYRGTLRLDSGADNPLKVYTVDVETGALTLQAELKLEEDDMQNNGRVDFIDVVGDLTRENARCVVMAAPSSTASPAVYGWVAEQGDAEFGPHMVDGSYISFNIDETYPETEAGWNGGTCVQIIRDDEFTGLQFYLDDMNTLPVLYDNEANLRSTFGDLPQGSEVQVPKTNCNGALEVTLGDDVFFVYPVDEYVENDPTTTHSAISKFGIPGEIGSLEQFYIFPASHLGCEKGGPGSRFHRNQLVAVDTDANGKQAATIFTYKSGNGGALYQLAQEGYAGVENAVISNNAAVEYFNLQGIRVANPENGIFIRRQGGETTKVVL